MQPIGLLALKHHFKLEVPDPQVTSYATVGNPFGEPDGYRLRRHYRTAVDDTPLDHLRFALRNEPTDLGVLLPVLLKLKKEVQDWVLAEPKGTHSRRAWFFFEHLLGQALDVPDASGVRYASALDVELHFTATGIPSRRHLVTDNLLGGPLLCPTVRRTSALEAAIAARLEVQVRELAGQYSPELLSRAMRYLYTKETRSSFAIEGVRPSERDTLRFVLTLEKAGQFVPDKASLLTLQNQIITDPALQANDWRDFQIYVGQSTPTRGEIFHYIGPKPSDVAALMEGWAQLNQRLQGVHPVIAAAVSSFALVFIHPLPDGNGRSHRFLIHHWLERRGFTPPGMIFPVSASIVRDAKGYDEALEAFSRPLLAHLDWYIKADGTIEVKGDSASLYRYFDATAQVEYLFAKIKDTLHADLRTELEFLRLCDELRPELHSIAPLSQDQIATLIESAMQQGKLWGKRRKRYFAGLDDAQVEQLEQVVLRALKE